MVSIKDVANLAGVSVATVSRVINNSDSVSIDTKNAVDAAIEKLGYRVNMFGKSLRCNSSKIIMVLLSSLSNTFCSDVIRSIDKYAVKNGYYIIICATNEDLEKEKHYIDFAKNRLCDGLIILTSSLDENGIVELTKSIPVVQVNEYVKTKKSPYITIDNFNAAYDATKLLIAHGRKKIALFSVDNNFVSTNDRTRGYKKALADSGIKFDENLIIKGNYGFRNAYKVTTEFIENGNTLDGIFAIGDRMACGAMNALIDKGFKVPEDIEIVGFDNCDISYTSKPTLTTVSQPHDLLGKSAVDKIISLINGNKVENDVLSYQIIERNSTRGV